MAVATPSSDIALQGTIHGGQQPVSGSHVYLMQAGSSGYGMASTSIIVNGDGSDSHGNYVLSDANGNFTLTATYVCTPNKQVYAVALGGNPGLEAGTNNTSLGLMSNLGNCPSLGTLALQVPTISINEVTTVAAVYSLAGYMTGAFQVSSSGSALAATGLANAFTTSGNLVSLVSGMAYGMTPAGNGTVPQSTINTLANIVAACVNTNGEVTPASGSGASAVSATPCYTLFSNAKNGTITPTNTVDAMLNIAHNPATNVSAIYGLASSTAPFQPSLATAPSDFTLSVVYTVPGMGNPTAGDTHAHNVAVDATGNVWSANDAANTLGEASTLGVPLAGSTGFTGNGMRAPSGVAIDTTGSVYVPNAGTNTVSVFGSQGGARAMAPVLTVGQRPVDVAIDANGNAWIVNFGGSSVSEYSSAGVQAAGSPFLGNGLSTPAGVAIEASGNVWIADSGSKELIAFTSAGAPVQGSPFSLAGESVPFGIAIDGTANVWSTDEAKGVFATNSAGAELTGAPFYGNSTATNAVAIDGAGDVWVTDSSVKVLNVFNASGAVVSGTNGFQTGSTAADSIAIDGAGNVWFTPVNSATVADTATSGNTIREMVGAAAPVVTPLAAAVAAGTLGTRP